ncbi:MAG: hypothetical protein ACI9XB_001551 [Gammaproteobacteria bacterium]|jgi:hypothetical protein
MKQLNLSDNEKLTSRFGNDYVNQNDQRESDLYNPFHQRNREIILCVILSVFLFLLFFLQSCQAPQGGKIEAPISVEETQIAKDLIQGAFDDLWGGVDSTKISNYHTDDFIILENGEVWDNDRIKVFIRKQLVNTERAKRTNRMEYISIDKYGPSIQIAYHNFADFSKGDSIVGKARWLESALAVPTEKGWRLKMMHSTYVRE